MRAPLIVAAVVSGFAVTASAASFDAPAVLTAPHAAFLAELEEAAAAPGEVGATARTAADLFGPHNAAEERIVLPLLGHAEPVAAGVIPAADPRQMREIAALLGTELPALLDEQAAVINALVEFYATADLEGQPTLASLAERMIWHEMSDAEVLYPAAVLVGAHARARMVEPEPVYGPTGPGSLYGPDPTPMMGVGSPHPVDARP